MALASSDLIFGSLSDWWSLAPAAVAFVALYIFALRIRSDLAFLALFLAGPVVAASYAGLLAVAAPPSGGWGFLALISLTLLLLAGWEAGLLLGTLYRFLRPLLGISS